MKLISLCGLMLTSAWINAQIPAFRDTIALGEIVVSAYKDEVARTTSLHIETLRLGVVAQQGSFNLTDALTRITGVSQLSTGIGISKPVIRGLYGNRILVVFSGLRFDNQQWQDEHGLGLSDIGISKVEILKGPLSMLYGTEAVGGVINILEEKIPEPHMKEIDAALTFHSNTLGGSLQAGMKSNAGNHWFRLRLGLDNHADYSDGNDVRVLNSRFNGYYLKSTYGFLKENWHSENYYHFSFNNFGFIFNDLIHFFPPDDRWSKAMTGPHHIVMLNLLSSVNTIQLPTSTLKVNVGLQSNVREEDEGGGSLSLIMHLFTGEYAMKWNKTLSKQTELVVAHGSTVQTNTNYGKRKLIPDALIIESNVSGYVKHTFDQFITEYGLGMGLRHIHTYLTKTVNTGEKDIDPFQQTRFFGNGMAGVRFQPTAQWNFRLNVASGVRAPNLAELSSNGLHEGVYIYELGNPDLKNEQNINTEITAEYASDFLECSVSVYYNYFFHYIYLQPTDIDWFGFPVSHFVQYDAKIYGEEISLMIHPVQQGSIGVSYSGLIGKLDQGEYLPYMPAQKVEPEIRWESLPNTEGRNGYVFLNTDLVFQQDKLNGEETKTPSYTLLNAGMGVTLEKGQFRYDISITGNNLLNEAYYDHLSRIKNFGLLNIGRDVALHFKITLFKPSNH